jgi:hypothetical protein
VEKTLRTLDNAFCMQESGVELIITIDDPIITLLETRSLENKICKTSVDIRSIPQSHGGNYLSGVELQAEKKYVS